MGDLFTARFAYCIFDKAHFSALGGESLKLKECREISWKEDQLNYLGPCTRTIELEVQKIINLRNLASKPPDAFTDHKGVTKSHIPVENAPSKVEIPL